MTQERHLRADTYRVIRGRPHERTIERLAFRAWVDEFDGEKQVSAATMVWLNGRFLDELDRRRGLEHRWRKVFWLTRYLVLAGSLVLPVLIAVGKTNFPVNVAGVAVSIIVALATAMEALLRSGRKWRLYRQGADKMSSEGAAFFQNLGVYAAAADPAERMSLFKERIEANIRDLHESYVADIEIVASQNVIGSSSDRPA